MSVNPKARATSIRCGSQDLLEHRNVHALCTNGAFFSLQTIRVELGIQFLKLICNILIEQSNFKQSHCCGKKGLFFL